MRVPVEIFEKIMNFSPQSIVKKLIINGVISKSDINKIDIDKNLIHNLLEYSLNNKVSIAEKLILSGIDPNTKIQSFGWPILSAASYKGQLNLVKILVNKNAEINANNSEAIKCAALKNNTHVVHFLISRGAIYDSSSLFSKEDYLANMQVISEDEFCHTTQTNELLFDRLLVSGIFKI